MKVDKKMESYPNSLTRESLKDSSEKCLGMKSGVPEKDGYVSAVTAKYKLSKSNVHYGNEVPKKCSGSPSHTKASLLIKSNFSSEDDCSSDDMSLGALVAKNKLSKTNIKGDSVTLGKDIISKSSSNKMEDSHSDSSDNECFSLHMLASKYKSTQISGSGGNNLISSTSKACTKNNENASTAPTEYVNKFKHKAYKTFENFSDESDSDEYMTLAGLVSNKTISPEEAITVPGDNLKPRELSLLVSTQRHYTKSESDSYAPSFHSAKKVLLNETSTSLGSLKGAGSTTDGFQFSLGCTIPNSFRSKNELTSSIKALDKVGAKHSYSDPQVNVMSTVDHNHDAGINLSCAIKTASVRSEQQIEVDVFNEPEELEIMTLLDQLNVEEEKEECDEKMEEDCSYDATNILNEKLKLRTTKCSSFGKVVCRNWKPLCAPYVKKENIHSTVVPFNFSTLSPDDEVASHLNKRH